MEVSVDEQVFTGCYGASGCAYPMVVDLLLEFPKHFVEREYFFLADGVQAGFGDGIIHFLKQAAVSGHG